MSSTSWLELEDVSLWWYDLCWKACTCQTQSQHLAKWVPVPFALDTVDEAASGVQVWCSAGSLAECPFIWVKGTWLITTLYETALLVFVGISTYWTHFSQLCNGWSPWAQQLLGECHGPLYCARGEIVWCHCWCGLPGFWFTERSENSEQPNCTFPGRGSSTSKP